MAARTVARRQKREHALKCLKLGALQRLHHMNESLQVKLLSLTEEGEVVLRSIGVHRADCFATDTPHHWSACSNLEALHAGLKSNTCYKAHKQMHGQANRIKHDTANRDCHDTAPGAGQANFLPHDDPAVISWAANGAHEHFAPFTGSAHQLRADAPVFTPSSGLGLPLSSSKSSFCCLGERQGVDVESHDEMTNFFDYVADCHSDTSLDSSVDRSDWDYFGLDEDDFFELDLK